MRVLLFEPNPYHYEVIPGFAYYFIRLGYEIDCLLQKSDREGDAFIRCPSLKNRIRFYYYREGEGPQRIRELQTNCAYDLLFATSFDRKQGAGWTDTFRDMLSFDQSRLGVIGCYHTMKAYLLDRQNGPLPTDRIVSLTPVDSGEGFFTEVNANYFCDQGSDRPKNRVTRILSIGHNADRYALRLAAEAAERDGKQRVSVVCACRKMPAREFVSRLIAQRGGGDAPSDRNFPPLFHRHIRVLWGLSFRALFREIDRADFLDASVLPEQKTVFTSNRTSGTKQLSLGFLKPCIREKEIAEYYGFSERSAVIYTEGKMEDAVLRAARMPEEEYRAMVAELEKLRDEVRARSERNLKDM